MPTLLKTLKEEKKYSVTWWGAVAAIAIVCLLFGSFSLLYWFNLFRDMFDAIIKWF